MGRTALPATLFHRANRRPEGATFRFPTNPPALRCYQQKRRYGVSTLYPVQRYIDGLTKRKIYNRQGQLVENPLLKGRPNGMVLYASIVGVPWQDIAIDSADLSQGYKTTAEVDWSLILGDMRHNEPPLDPLMRESSEPRTGQTVLGEELSGPGTWNSINGHEYETSGRNLQHARIFGLPAPHAGKFGDCDAPDTSKSPLCEAPSDPSNPNSAGTNQYGDTQYRAKAYPGTRFLELVKGLP